MDGTIHLRHRQIFHDFRPLPPFPCQFFTTIRHQIWQIFDPSPLKNADVLNGWFLAPKYIDIPPNHTQGGVKINLSLEARAEILEKIIDFLVQTMTPKTF